MMTPFVIKLVSEVYGLFRRVSLALVYFCVSYIIVISDRIGHTLFKIVFIQKGEHAHGEHQEEDVELHVNNKEHAVLTNSIELETSKKDNVIGTLNLSLYIDSMILSNLQRLKTDKNSLQG